VPATVLRNRLRAAADRRQAPERPADAEQTVAALSSESDGITPAVPGGTAIGIV
jgi:hypothetical protein